MGNIKKRCLIGLLACMLISAPFMTSVSAEESIYLHKPPAGAMVADFVLMRPLGIVATAGGSVLFVLTLPFSALGQNVGDAGQALVVKPAKFTFTRPLGEIHTTQLK